MVKVKPRDTYRLGLLPVDDEFDHGCMPSNTRNEDEFRDPTYCSNVS